MRALVRAAVVVALTLVAAVGTTNIALARARVEADPLLSIIQAAPSLDEAEPPLLGYRAAPARAPTVSMRVRATERARPIVAALDGSERMILAARTVSVRGAPSDVAVLLVGARLDALRIGDTVDVDGSVRESAPGTAEVAWVSVRALPRVGTPGPGGPAQMIQRAVDGLREGLVQAASVLPGSAGTLLPGLAIGETRTLPVDLDQAMRDTGLTHLVAVSGANCAVVIAVCAGLAALMGAGRRIRIVAGAIGLGGFVLLVGPDPSVLRAAVMAAVVLGFLLHGRPGAGVPLLNIAVIVLLLLEPGLATDFGFILSVAATAGLIMLSTPLAVALSRWLPTWLSYALAIPAAAQLACGPILILLRPEISLTAIPANLLAEPAAPLATLMGLIVCIAHAIWPPLGLVAVWFAWLPTAWIIAVARVCAAVPGGLVPWLPGPVGALGLLALTLVLLGYVLHRAHRIRWGVAILVTGSLLTGSAVIPAVLARAGTPTGWIIAACDVGQGDAILVRSRGRVALVDSGRDPAALTQCLDRLGIDRINLFVLTHYDADHSGGIAALGDRIDAALIATPRTEQDKRVRAQLPSSARLARDGDTGALGGLSWRVFWPPSVTSGLSANGSAVVWGFEGEGTRALFLADLGAETQSLLIPALAKTSYARSTDVVKVAHHGSADQDPELYRALHPRIGVISVGAANTYGHPRTQTLSFLSALGVRILRTDQSGTVFIVRTGRGLEVRTER
ncbi:ComEC/Rec2 family competence protein [Mycetocola lacteus]|uniref:ComEC/Rec2 family competence protein n=1 Tax=Mycetocola lacteus TaxID=76637 RepID=UPI0016043BD6|nr:ComEC/Rec2 family competence protein [Mycetocola lacteus]